MEKAKLAIEREINDIARARLKLKLEDKRDDIVAWRARAGLGAFAPSRSSFLLRVRRFFAALICRKVDSHLVDIEREAACWILIKRHNMQTPPTEPAQLATYEARGALLAQISAEIHEKVWQFSNQHMRDAQNWSASATAAQNDILARSKSFGNHVEAIERRVKATEMAAQELWLEEKWKIDEKAFAEFESFVAGAESEAALSEKTLAAIRPVQISELSSDELIVALPIFREASVCLSRACDMQKRSIDCFDLLSANKPADRVVEYRLSLVERRNNLEAKIARLEKIIESAEKLAV